MKIEKGSLAQEVMKKIVSHINRGIFPSGSKLPPNEELAKMFGTGRSSIREALKELQTLGIVNLKHGEGTYICTFPSDSLGPMTYVAEVRRMIETYSVQEGIKYASPEDMQQLQELYEAMEIHFDDISLFIYYDRQFHYKIAEFTKNPVMISILKSLEILFVQLQSELITSEGQNGRALKEHKAILDAILQRDLDKSLREVNKHYDNLIKLIEER